ncbi:DUF1998 domain-containing protein [Lichenibacterium minor]|uniref:DUF1998 domain-containing protein n=1 Tax=Lichenibacterium minor TaxID=2316528 RepID=A0A4Q2U1F2_9HYPH|nr:DUF1998 domain-containing protein [Lichenibacterium minor]RYC30289.1 DUF1998 domain-containing protein [Lichenibacterium minor]
MPAKDIGELRRSAVIGTFGPGAVVDFRTEEAAVSAVISSLEEWDRNFKPAGMLNPQTVFEVRLQKKLNVKGFRLPPVRDPLNKQDKERSLVAVRFPRWLQCPGCDRIGDVNQWNGDPGEAACWCTECSRKRSAALGKQYVVPVRFITACEHGHLDDFPWHFWVQHREECNNRNGFLRLRSEEPGLSGIFVSCDECKARRSLDGVFSTRQRILPACRGKRPWLADGDETCGAPDSIRTMQRGASNLYFPVIESALSIPPWSDRLQEAMGVMWDIVATSPFEQRANTIRLLETHLSDVLTELDLTPEQLSIEVEQRLQAHNAIELDDLRREEYRQLNVAVATSGPDREFEVRPRQVPDEIRKWISRVVKAVRLREVRAMTGFTRIHPAGDTAAPNIARLSLAPLSWLPAIEVRGEGIFLAFDEERLQKWEKLDSVRARAGLLNERFLQEWRGRQEAETPPPLIVTPRFLLLHTFAHSVMRQLTLDCGYSSTALRERLYIETGEYEMAGVLIYTATGDDDGTLGGLQRQGDSERIGRTVIAAVQAQAWCSSDPLCIDSRLTNPEAMSHAACHACVLAPETACEHFNRFLDRAMLVGLPDEPSVGFFCDLVTRSA